MQYNLYRLVGRATDDGDVSTIEFPSVNDKAAKQRVNRELDRQPMDNASLNMFDSRIGQWVLIKNF